MIKYDTAGPQNLKCPRKNVRTKVESNTKRGHDFFSLLKRMARIQFIVKHKG